MSERERERERERGKETSKLSNTSAIAQGWGVVAVYNIIIII